jgi:hypothetical protein
MPLAERACELTKNKDMVAVATLAMAYAEAGRWQQAVDTASKAVEVAKFFGDAERARDYEKLVEQFSARIPYRQRPD